MCTVCEFSPNEKEGLVKRKLTVAETESALIGASMYRIRTLGGDVEVLSDAESVFVEIEKDPSELSLIGKELEALRVGLNKMEFRMRTVERRAEEAEEKSRELFICKDDLERRAEEAEEKSRELFIYKDDFQGVAIRAFADLVVHAFLKKAKKLSMKPDSRHKFIMGMDGERFCHNHLGEVFPVMGAKVSIDKSLIQTIRDLRMASCSISVGSCHSSTAVKIAVAIENATLMAGLTRNVDAFKVLFSTIFGIDSSELATSFLSNEEVATDLQATFKVPF